MWEEGVGVDRLDVVRVSGQMVVLTAVTDSTMEVDEAGQFVTEAGQDKMVMVSVENCVEINTAGSSSTTTRWVMTGASVVVTVETSLSGGGSATQKQRCDGDGELTASAFDDARLRRDEHAGRGDGELLELHLDDCRAVRLR